LKVRPILGTHHFENPGLGIQKLRAANVLSATRQAELEAIAASIASFRPTRVMVEMVSQEPRRVVKGFLTFSDDTLTIDAKEIIQLGFRVARLVDLSEVNGINMQSSPGGESHCPHSHVVAPARRLGRVALPEEAESPSPP
jgi:hypothetical protein